jgi:hypothetical protein
MGKDTKRGNREVRKPKKAKQAPAASATVGMDVASALAGPKKKR